MKIALVALHAGYVNRGAERWAYELWRRFEPDCRVFSLAATEWTTRVRGVRRGDLLQRVHATILKPVSSLRLDARVFKRWNWGLVFSPEVGLEHFSFARNLYAALEGYRPGAVMACAGPVQAGVIARYSSDHDVPFLAVSGTGKSPTAVREARTGPDVECVQTASARDYIRQQVPGLRVECVPNGVDMDAFSPDGRTCSLDQLAQMAHKADINIQRPLFYSVSALSIAEKRIDALIRAVRQIDRGTLILAGDGPDREVLTRMGDALLGRRFAYIGVLTNEQVAAVTNTIDVTGLFSPREAFGTVLIEAMSAGKPVVANDNEDTRWIVGARGGILTNVMDDVCLAGALREAADRRWGNGPREQARAFGSWDAVAARYLALAREACERRARRS